MRGLMILTAAVLFGVPVFGQQAEKAGMSDVEAAKMARLPDLQIPEGYSFKSLPTARDNSTSPYFPDVFSQEGWSCNQASSIGYVFTYEINAMRNEPASSSENLYPPTFVWNFLNSGDWEVGVSYFDSWEIIRANGIPSVADYGIMPNPMQWVSGYDIYHKGMYNRAMEVYNLFVGDPDGLRKLKGWLNDHLDGSPSGGLANFQIGSTGMRAVPIGAGLEEEGKFIMEYFNRNVGHAMAFVGWNDSVRHDFNGDGLYTNDVDTNEDGKIDMRDWEVGAMLAINSWGSEWPGSKQNGRVYIPYRLLALDSWQGGIWTRSVTVMKPRKDYSPKLTVKAKITHTKRNQIKVVAGVAKNFAAEVPEVVLEFPIFNFQGGSLPMQGITGAGSESLEFGLDISPLLNYIDPNIPAKFFLEVYHREGAEFNGSGKIDYFSIMDYGSGTVIEEMSPQTNVGIRIREVTRVSVIYDPVAGPVQISTASLPDAHVGQGYSHIMQASGGTAPYKWSNMADEYVAEKISEEWTFPFADKILGVSDTSRQLVSLGFSFPFYGKEYSEMIVLKGGGLIMGAYPRDYPYVIDPRTYIFQNAGIYPFYTNLEYLFPGDGVYRLDDDEGVTIIWDATLSRSGEVYDPKFGVKLFRDGTIETGYFTTSIKTDWNWIAGVSAGDMRTYTLPEINNDPVFYGGFSIRYTMNNWPSWLYFSEGGALLGVPEDGASRVFLPIRVEDNTGLYNTNTFNLQINGTSSLDQTGNTASLDIYPNPFNGRINLKLNNPGSSDIRFELFSLDGRMVYSEHFAPSTHISIDLSGVGAEGSYFYQLEAAGEVHRGKLIRAGGIR